jgi:hypothetical protein
MASGWLHGSGVLRLFIALDLTCRGCQFPGRGQREIRREERGEEGEERELA